MPTNRDLLLEVYNPFTQEAMDTIELLDFEQATKLVSKSQAFFRESLLPKYERIERLNKLIQLVKTHQSELITVAVKEGGKPLGDTQVEMARAINTLEQCVYHLATDAGQEIPMGLTAATVGRRAFVQKFPLGLCLGIGAFNHPINMIMHLVGPALAVGAPIIVKPALKTLLVAKRIVDLVHEAGFAEAACQYLLCNDEVTSRLAQGNSWSNIVFIGSEKVGWNLRSNLAPGVRCTLEHGGMAPVIIDEGADLTKIIEPIAKSAFYHAGQVCVSTQRIYVHQSMYDDFTSAFIGHVSSMSHADPMRGDTDIGPMITQQAADRVVDMYDEAVHSGAEILLPLQKERNLISPGVLTNVPHHVTLANAEVFGPLVQIESVESIEQGIGLANATPYCFQSSIYTNDINHAFQAADQLRATAVMINDHPAFRADWMPFGGAGLSGQGMGGVSAAMHELQLEKQIILKSN